MPENPASEDEIQNAENALGQPLLDDWREALLNGGGSLYGKESCLSFFPARHLAKFLPSDMARELEGMIIFGNDEGDFIYYFDPDDRLHGGAWSVYAVTMGARAPRWSIHVARNLRHLLERMIAGEETINGPFLTDK